MKNKLYPPFREAEFDITFDHGIDTYGALLKLGLKFGVVKKNGSFYKVEGLTQSFYAKSAQNTLEDAGIDLRDLVLGAAPSGSLKLLDEEADD